jgi:hypothetical protein
MGSVSVVLELIRNIESGLSIGDFTTPCSACPGWRSGRFIVL